MIAALSQTAAKGPAVFLEQSRDNPQVKSTNRGHDQVA